FLLLELGGSTLEVEHADPDNDGEAEGRIYGHEEGLEIRLSPDFLAIRLEGEHEADPHGVDEHEQRERPGQPMAHARITIGRIAPDHPRAIEIERQEAQSAG